MSFFNSPKRSKKSKLSRKPSIFDLKKEANEDSVVPTASKEFVDSALNNKKSGTLSEEDIKRIVAATIERAKREDSANGGDDETAAGVADIVKPKPPKCPVQTSSHFDMDKDEWTLGELLDLNVTSIPFLVEKLIPLHTLNVLAGQSERGKSILYTQLALAIVRGDQDFLECKINATYKKVLVVSSEDGPVVLSCRALMQLKTSAAASEYRERLVFITNHENLEERIELFLEKTKVDLIIMDAFADVFTGGDINAANSVRRYFNIYLKFIQKYGCSVLFVHHVSKGKQGNKAEKDQLLGSTGIEGKMRNVLMLSIVNDQHQLSIAKSNYINREAKKTPLYLSFDTDTLTFSVADGPAEAKDGNDSHLQIPAKKRPGKKKDMDLVNKALSMHAEGKTQEAISKIVGKHKSTVCKWIKEADESKPRELPIAEDYQTGSK